MHRKFLYRHTVDNHHYHLINECFIARTHREFERNRSKNICLKRSTTFSYLTLQGFIIVACVFICALPYWFRCHFFELQPEKINGTSPVIFCCLKFACSFMMVI